MREQHSGGVPEWVERIGAIQVACDSSSFEPLLWAVEQALYEVENIHESLGLPPPLGFEVK